MASIRDEKLLKSLRANSSIKKIKEDAKTPTKSITYIGFIRVSTQKQGVHGISQDTQEKLIENYCTAKKYQLADTYRLIESASKGHRTKFRLFLKYISGQKNKVAIIVSRTDRLTRQDCFDLDELRKKDKIEIHLIDRYSVLTSKSTPDELANWEIGVTYAKRESRMIGQRVNEVRLEQMENGQYLREAPVGYLNVTDKTTGKKTIIVDKEKGHLVKKILLEFAKGTYTEKTLCDYAEKLGLRSNKGNIIKPGCMGALLHNTFYCGYFTDHNETYEHHYEKLISLDTYAKIQAILDKKNKKAPKPNQYNSKVFVLSNIIQCKCGCKMTPYEKKKANGKTYRYLLCSHASTTIPCDVKQVNEDKFLDQIKAEVLDKLHFDPEILKIYQPAIKREIQQELDTSKNELNKLQQEQQRIEEERKDYLKSVVKGIITRAEYDLINEDLCKQEAKVAEDMASISISQERAEAILKRIIKLLSFGIKAFESSKVTEKNQLLKILLLNCIYDGEKLQISVKKPFDLFISNGLNQLWQGHLRNSRAEFMRDLLLFGKDVKVFLNNV